MPSKRMIKELDRYLGGRKAFGQSKAADKASDRERAAALSAAGKNFDKSESLVKERFYTKETYNLVRNEGCRFVSWARAQAGRRLSVEECRPYVESYLNEKMSLYSKGELSAGTLQAKRSQLSKLYRMDLDKYTLPRREAPTKGREHPEKWENYKQNHPDAARFYAAVGCRQFEYKYLGLQEFKVYASKCEAQTGFAISRDCEGRASNLQVAARDEKGHVSAVVIAHGKHGKSRLSEIAPQNRAYLTEIIDSGKVYDYFNPSDRVPTQAARREYAQQLYAAHARPLDALTREQIYTCRDGSGRNYDRAAVALVSQSLGHGSDRYTYVVNNYLR